MTAASEAVLAEVERLEALEAQLIADVEERKLDVERAARRRDDTVADLVSTRTQLSNAREALALLEPPAVTA